MIFRPEYIAAALHRARTWAEDHPADGPPLTEPRASRRRTTCRDGHPIVERNGRRRCAECDRIRKRKA